MRLPWLDVGMPFAPSSQEQKAIEHLIRDRKSFAAVWFDRALIDDPTRLERICDQWDAGAGRGGGIYTKAALAIYTNDITVFLKEIGRVYSRHGVQMPEDGNNLFADIRKSFHLSKKTRNKPPAYAPSEPLNQAASCFTLPKEKGV